MEVSNKPVNNVISGCILIQTDKSDSFKFDIQDPQTGLYSTIAIPAYIASTTPLDEYDDSYEKYYMVNHVCWALGYRRNIAAQISSFEYYNYLSKNTQNNHNELIILAGVPAKTQNKIYPLNKQQIKKCIPINKYAVFTELGLYNAIMISTMPAAKRFRTDNFKLIQDIYKNKLQIYVKDEGELTNAILEGKLCSSMKQILQNQTALQKESLEEEKQMQMPDILMTYKLGLMGGRDINQPESEDSYEENKVLDYDFSDQTADQELLDQLNTQLQEIETQLLKRETIDLFRQKDQIKDKIFSIKDKISNAKEQQLQLRIDDGAINNGTIYHIILKENGKIIYCGKTKQESKNPIISPEVVRFNSGNSHKQAITDIFKVSDAAHRIMAAKVQKYMTKNNITRYSPDLVDIVLKPIMIKNNIKTEKQLDIEETREIAKLKQQGFLIYNSLKTEMSRSQSLKSRTRENSIEKVNQLIGLQKQNGYKPDSIFNEEQEDTINKIQQPREKTTSTKDTFASRLIRNRSQAPNMQTEQINISNMNQNNISNTNQNDNRKSSKTPCTYCGKSLAKSSIYKHKNTCKRNPTRTQ